MKIMPVGDYYVWHCDWWDSIDTVIVTVLTEVMAFWYQEMEWQQIGMVIALILSLAGERIVAVRYSPRRFREEL